MATRLFDLFAAQIGSSPALGTPTQLVGPETLEVNNEHDEIVADNDGVAGPAALDQGTFRGHGRLQVQDLTTLMTILAAWEGATGGLRAIQAEGTEAGAATVTKVLVKRAALVGCTVSLRRDEYSHVSYDWRVSADSASNTDEDEIAYTSGAVKTATIGAGLRTFKLAAAFGGVSALALSAAEITMRGNMLSDVGDAEFGETVVVAGYRVGGTLTFKDFTVATGLSAAQTLIAGAVGSLTITALKQGGSASATITLANCRMFRARDQRSARRYGEVVLGFGCQFTSGTTPYTLATGVNKIITIA